MDHRSLLLLGLLISQSQHGYQIHDFIETNLPFITDMKKATAYAHLEKLSKGKYIDVSVEQEGSRPPRKVYSINNQGMELFYQLLAENLAAADTVFYEGDIGLMFLDHLPVEDTVHYLNKRRKDLEKKHHAVQLTPLHDTSKGVNIAFQHKKKMLEAELSFLNETIQQLKASPDYNKEVE
ncbi:PadR family transcriptional regulator [Bacillus piscicola]|uniref:PadR family transcriptional regulator n=1 Tax=Bacillus piscicola TaxID=1632684 RepID=UPI001F0892BF|nr:PadR family transcriptional regulator [Bacillus piscicola]